MRRLKSELNGSITIFLTLILVPCVVCVCLFIDLARFEYVTYKIESSSDLALNAAMTQYNGLLQDMYGLFGIENDEKLEESIQHYFILNLDENHQLSDKSCQKVKGSNVDIYQINTQPTLCSITGGGVSGNHLAQPIVLKEQIVEFMKYIAPYNLLSKSEDIFKQLEHIKSIPNDSRAIRVKNKIDKSMSELDSLLQDLNKVVKDNDNATVAVDKLKIHYETMNRLFEEKKELSKKITELESGLKNPEEQLSDEDKKAMQEGLEGLKDKLEEKNKEVEKSNIKEIISKVKGDIDALYSYQKKIDETIGDIAQNLNNIRKNRDDLQNKKDNTSIKEELEEQIKKYDEILGEYGKIEETFKELTKTSRGTIEELERNLADILNLLGEYDYEEKHQVIDFSSLTSTPQIIFKNHPTTQNFVQNHLLIYDQEQEKDESLLTKITKALTYKEENEDNHIAGQSQEIPESIYEQLRSGGGDENNDNGGKSELDRADEMLSEGEKFSFPSILDTLENMRDQYLIVDYAMGMFSYYTSNKEDGNTSYTNVPIDEQNNFLYLSEMEYILSGQRKAASNIRAVSNKIKNIRFCFNYIYTFTDKELNATLDAVVSAVSATLTPVAGFATKEMLRVLITEYESYEDVKALKEGEVVPLFKNSSTWRTKISSLLNGIVESNSIVKEGLNYGEYIRLFLLFQDSNKTLQRIANLIELNMTYHQNDGVLGSQLTTRLDDLYISLEISGQMEVDYLFMKLPFVQTLLGSDFQVDGQKLDFSIKRGY